MGIRDSPRTRSLVLPARLLHGCECVVSQVPRSELAYPPGGSHLPMGVLYSALLPSITQEAHTVFTGTWPAAGVPAGLNHRGPPSPMCSTGTSSLFPKSWPVGHVPVTDNTLSLAGTGGGVVRVAELELQDRSRPCQSLHGAQLQFSHFLLLSERAGSLIYHCHSY